MGRRPGGMEGLVTPSRRFWSGRRVLLTGHTGFKGAWCAIWLQRLGAQVHGLALEPEGADALWPRLGRPAAGETIGDVRDPRAVAAAFAAARPEIVIHMAAQALVQRSYQDPVETFGTNVMGLVRVLEAARAQPGLQAVVNVTSDKCYENREQIWAYREHDAMGGSDPYSASKGCAELVTASYRHSFFNAPGGPRLASGRAGNVVGGGDAAVDRLAPDCIAAFRRGEPVAVRNPLATRPWQHVLEPLSGYLVLAQALYERGSEAAEGWNFGPPDEDAWPVSTVVARLAAAWGEGARWEPAVGARPHEAMLLRVDAAKARTRLKWRPRLRVGEALDWTVAWARVVDGGASALSATLGQIEAYEAMDAQREAA